MTFTRFVGGAHPFTFANMSVSPILLRSSVFFLFLWFLEVCRLRHQDGYCDVAAARDSAAHFFDGIPEKGTCIFRNFTDFGNPKNFFVQVFVLLNLLKNL